MHFYTNNNMFFQCLIVVVFIFVFFIYVLCKYTFCTIIYIVPPLLHMAPLWIEVKDEMYSWNWEWLQFFLLSPCLEKVLCSIKFQAVNIFVYNPQIKICCIYRSLYWVDYFGNHFQYLSNVNAQSVDSEYCHSFCIFYAALDRLEACWIKRMKVSMKLL